LFTKFGFIHLIRFRVANARALPTSFHDISIRPWVKLNADYYVDKLKARWLLPVLAESHRLIRRNQAKDVAAVHVWNAPYQS